MFLGGRTFSVHLYHQTITIIAMKKLMTNTNPFILLLLPALLVIAMGISRQVKQDGAEFKSVASAACTTQKATSLFTKSVTLFKAVCSVAKQKEW
jgi:hypothetical protein